MGKVPLRHPFPQPLLLHSPRLLLLLLLLLLPLLLTQTPQLQLLLLQRRRRREPASPWRPCGAAS